MKANEAPTKLYVNTNDHLTRNGFYAFTENNRKDSVEYTRTDAFIEKACEWLKESITNNPKTNRIISLNGTVTMGILIEDFKKYMKGEKVC